MYFTVSVKTHIGGKISNECFDIGTQLYSNENS